MPTQPSLFDLFNDDSNDDNDVKEEPKNTTEELTPALLATYSEYWWAAHHMVSEFMEFVRLSKFRTNVKYLDKVPEGLETAYQKCFGSSRRLDNHVGWLESKFMAALAAYQSSCEKLGIDAVDINWLISQLWNDANRRRSIRDKCERRAKNPTKYRPVPISEL